jgi:hypothetical protein
MRTRSPREDVKKKPKGRQKSDTAWRALVETWPGWKCTAYSIRPGRLDFCKHRGPLRWDLPSDEAP